MLDLLAILLKRWRLVAGLPVATAALAVALALLTRPTYTATTTFAPETEPRSQTLGGGLLGLAAQFGITTPGIGSAGFYVDVLASRTLTTRVLEASFPDPRTPAPEDSVVLLDIFGIEGATQAARLEEGRRTLEDATVVGVAETGIVAVSVKTAYPELSARVANLYVDLLGTFNVESRRSSARERRRFVEERVRESEAELEQAEEELKRFLTQNRQFENSPDLRVEYERLQRQVSIKQEVLISLRRQYEDARIQEVNDTPVITIIDRAIPPNARTSPKRRQMVILAFFLGGLGSVVLAFLGEYIERARLNGDTSRVADQWMRLRREVRTLVRLDRGAAGSAP